MARIMIVIFIYRRHQAVDLINNAPRIIGRTQSQIFNTFLVFR
jgi:hypothetical protein